MGTMRNEICTKSDDSKIIKLIIMSKIKDLWW